MTDVIFFAAPGFWVPTAVACVFGLLVGSFLNVVIHRFPRMMQREFDNDLKALSDPEERKAAQQFGSAITALHIESSKPLPHEDQYNLVLPRSTCPSCGHQITALENIPVLSYLVLRGRCSACKTPISARYPLVEIIASVLSGVLIWHFGSGWLGLSTLVFAYLLLAMSLIDLDTTLLPDQMTYSLLWLGLFVNMSSVFVPLPQAIIGAMAGYMSLWLTGAVFKLIRGQVGMGNGDFKLLAALGAWLGWQMLPLIILLSALVGAIVGITVLKLQRKGLSTQIPFGPYLAGAGLVALLWGREITMFYLNQLHPY